MNNLELEPISESLDVVADLIVDPFVMVKEAAQGLVFNNQEV